MMSFHPQKCQLLRITRNKSPVKASYVKHGHTFAETDTAKYLGVSLHRHSSWSPHVNATTKKANGTRAFLQRNLRKATTAVKTRTYESRIRPILEYSGVVWDPHNAQDVNKLEMAQHRYARYTSRDYGRTSSVTAILKTLGWEPLAERRAKARITMNSSWSCWHPGIGPHHTGTCKQKERQCPVPRTIRADFGIPARNLPRRHAPVEMKWWCFRPLLCTLLRLNWAKQTPGIMRRN